jgi:1,4-alpha-glucan branching enzyme
MSFSNREQGHHHKEALLPKARDIDALVRAEHHDPFAILGPHGDGAGGQFIRAYLPDALSVQVVARESGEELGNLEATQTPGLFVGHFERAQPYLLRTRWAGGEQISRRPLQLWPVARRHGFVPVRRGQSPRSEQCPRSAIENRGRCRGCALRRVGAECQAGVGGRRLQRLGRAPPSDAPAPSHRRLGVFIPRLQAGEAYKYEILGKQGILPLKADPMALATSLPPDTASKVASPLKIDWQDQDWMLSRGERHRPTAPLSIYELHAGSWQCELDDLGEVPASTPGPNWPSG